MIDYSVKGVLNQHTLVKNPSGNISNSDNHQVFSQIINGVLENSEMMNYLLNMNHQHLSDYKSILSYNEMNVAAIRNEVSALNEVIGIEDVIELSKFKFSIKERFDRVLTHRKSVRAFSGYTLSEKMFSVLLHYSFGISQRTMSFGEKNVKTRYYSSGGGLYPVKIFIYCNNVETIPKGIYQYQPVSHTLHLISNSNIDIEQFFVGNNIDIISCNFTVFFGYQVSSTYLKYGELSLLNTLVEVGIIAHNFDLVSTSLGLNVCNIAGYNKNYIEKVLGFDKVDEHILFSAICGKE